jgi:hypothetical protein
MSTGVTVLAPPVLAGRSDGSCHHQASKRVPYSVVRGAPRGPLDQSPRNLDVTAGTTHAEPQPASGFLHNGADRHPSPSGVGATPSRLTAVPLTPRGETPGLEASRCSRPGLHFRPKPKQGPAPAEINYRSRHLRVPLLVAAHGIPVTQPQKVSNTLRVNQVLRTNAGRH